MKSLQELIDIARVQNLTLDERKALSYFIRCFLNGEYGSRPLGKATYKKNRKSLEYAADLLDDRNIGAIQCKRSFLPLQLDAIKEILAYVENKQKFGDFKKEFETLKNKI